MPAVPVITPNGERIREVREQLELTHADVAARMKRHRHPKNIALIEYGTECRVSTAYIQELADALGRPVCEFIKADAT